MRADPSHLKHLIQSCIPFKNAPLKVLYMTISRKMWNEQRITSFLHASKKLLFKCRSANQGTKNVIEQPSLLFMVRLENAVAISQQIFKNKFSF